MPKRGFPHQWYWVADDGRVFSAALQKIVDKNDPGFKQFLATGRSPTRWPVDLSGTQTNAELHAVVGQYGLSLSPQAALTKYVRDKHAALSAGGTVVNLGKVGQKPQLVEVDTSTRGLTTLHADFLHAQTNPQDVFHLHQSNGLSVQVSADQLKAAHRAAFAFVRASSRSMASVLNAINSQKITSKEQIDNPPTDVARWPVNP